MANKAHAQLLTWGSRLIAVLAVTAILVGCSLGKIPGLRTDPSFTHENLKRGNISVGGVVHTTKPFSTETTAQLSELFAKVIDGYKYNFKVVPPAAVAAAAGAPLLTQAQEAYANGDIPAEILIALRERVPDVRYLAFARITKDYVYRDRGEYAEREYDRKGRVARDNDVLVSETSRAVTLQADVYDLRSQRSVWSTTIEKIETSTEEADRYSGLSTELFPGGRKDGGLRDALARSVMRAGEKGNDYPEYPNAPKLPEVLKQMFGQITFNLPKW